MYFLFGGLLPFERGRVDEELNWMCLGAELYLLVLVCISWFVFVNIDC